MIGAILTQNTAWSNVEKAIANLKRAGKLSPAGLRRLSQKKLAALIRPSGYFNIKAGRLKHFIRFLFDEYGGDVKRMSGEEGARLREKLLRVKGIGPETADSILLYAAQKPFFVIDAYTKRIFSRHRLESIKDSGKGKFYEDWRALFTATLSAAVTHPTKRLDLFNDFHAQIVMLGKNFCKAKRPLCEVCPLSRFL